MARKPAGEQKVKQLEESEEKYRHFFETAMVGMYRTRIEDGTFLAANRTLAHLMGYDSVDEFIVEYVTSKHYTDPKRRGELLDQLQTQDRVDGFEIELTRTDGSLIQVAISAAIYPEHGYLEGVVVDITHRKQAEEALRRSETRYKSLTNNLNVGVYRNTSGPEGKFIEANPMIVKMFGYDSREEFLNVKVSDLYQDMADRKKFNEKIQKLGAVRNEELQLKRKDGTRFIGSVSSVVVKDEKGNVKYYDGIIEDITDRKQAENQLRRYQRIVDASGDHMALLDRNYVYKTVNDVYLKAMDKKREDIVGHTVAELFGEAFFKNYQKPNIDRSLAGESVRYQAWVDFPTLGKRYMDVRHSPHIEEDGSINYYTMNARDITELKTLQDQLHQAQKMEAIGTLAGGIAHDFNNLLMAIQGNASLILSGIDSSPPHYEKLKNIERIVKSGAKLTRQILGYARKGQYEVKPIDLNRIVEETTDTFGSAKKEILIHKKLAADLFPIEADHGQIEQILLNLYVNAADAMPRGGDLTIRTKNITHHQLKDKPYSPKSGNYVLLEVTDTGLGMDIEIQERIFEPFFTTKRMGGGTGLGLASVYGIVKAHGGYIDVESVKARGTTFSIYLPASKNRVISPVDRSEQIIKGNETILFVDDEEIVLEAGRMMLQHLGYSVFGAGGGTEALEVYENNADKIDLVVLDMIMPDMGGGDTYDKLKTINSSVKVLLSSGYSLEGQAKDILDRGCNGFIQKPFTLIELSQKIREVLGATVGTA